jgi:hypothetical protein
MFYVLYFPHHIIKVVPLRHVVTKREEVQLLLIIDLGTRWGEWSASCSGRTLPYPLETKLGGPQSWSEH